MVAVIKKKAIICALLLLVFLCACTGKPPAAEETTPLPQEEQKTEEISTALVEQPEPSEVPQEEEIALILLEVGYLTLVYHVGIADYSAFGCLTEYLPQADGGDNSAADNIGKHIARAH